jgi:hypothetical protein
MLAAAVVAAPVGALCVRYVKIYFGMLTLAFGMVFYTFLLKFYKLTGGDEGMRMLRPWLLGSEWAGFSKTAYLIGPYYYFSLAVLVLATLLMWRIVRSPLRPVPQDHSREPAQGGEPRGERAPLSLVRLHDLRRLRGGGRGAPRHAHRQRGSDPRLLDALWQHRLHGTARRLLVLLRPAPRRLRLHLPPGHRDVRLPLLAAHLRRRARLHRHLRPGRAHGPLRAAAGRPRCREA